MQSLIDAKTTRVLFTVLMFTLALSFLYVARHTLVGFLFAVFFAYLVDPAVSRVEKLVKSRGLAIAIIYVMLVVFFGGLLFLIGPRISEEARKLGESLPQMLDQISPQQIARRIGEARGWSHDTIAAVEGFMSSHRDTLSEIAQRIGLRAAELAQQSWLLIAVPVLAAFFLRDAHMFSEVALSFVNTRPQRELVQGVLADLNQMLAHFIRAQLTLAGLSLLAYLAFMGLLQVPYWAVLGTAGGMMEFVPVVGPLVAAVVILGVAMLTSYPHWLLLLIFLGFWRLVQDYVVSPRIMGKSMELHPLAAIFGVLAGGEIAGVLGIYLSIPVMASLRIVFRRWRLYAEKRRFGPLNEYSFGSEITPRR